MNTCKTAWGNFNYIVKEKDTLHYIVLCDELGNELDELCVIKLDFTEYSTLGIPGTYRKLSNCVHNSFIILLYESGLNFEQFIQSKKQGKGEFVQVKGGIP